ncbi:hypothetical protein EI42_06088 [Thermosporothrix hazakensis]|uniref:Uncharacterized protein n=3 Tax=Thermosporothrix TaxID=768650 RepID=A0A326TSL9_THEHA|nr:hypothetical protein EI42_06088 [Thermosporothrix hazakensis]BBH89862.1 hypothetical protein KTC_46130 [Thermosporothrix sp. COM3]GCE48058.1 hypothetical protein KTH_29270 [Thermosporothrix hazakensis]
MGMSGGALLEVAVMEASVRPAVKASAQSEWPGWHGIKTIPHLAILFGMIQSGIWKKHLIALDPHAVPLNSFGFLSL